VPLLEVPSGRRKTGEPLASKADALDSPHKYAGYMLPPPGTVDKRSVETGTAKGATGEIKEWQAIMEHLRSLPAKSKGELPTVPIDERRRGSSDQSRLNENFGRRNDGAGQLA
jgi:hypothetical protein